MICWTRGPNTDGPNNREQAIEPNTAGADFLQLHAGDAPARGVADWLAAEIRRAVGDGRVAPGARLPTTRALAADLGLSRGVVVAAYQRLHEQGLISARTGSGTVVSGQAPRGRPARTPPPAVDRLPLPSADGATIDLTPGLPDVSCFPRAAWLRHERAVLNQATIADLGYGDPRGHPVLRGELSAWLARTRGLRAEPDDILVVAGVAQSLALACQVAGRRGTRRVAVEDPGSRGARDEIAYWGLEPVPVPVDEHGMRTDELAATGAELALLTPAHHFPTGVVLGPQRRHALLGWAAADPANLVLEDDYDAEHRYDRAPVAALQPAAPEQVAHTGSMSKTLAPGVRLGWLVPPRALLAELTAAKHASDLGSPAVPQLVLARLLASGDLDRHLRAARARQRHRRDALIAAVREHLPDATISGVAAGLHVLLTLPGRAGETDDSDTDDTELAARIQRNGVLVHPLSWHRVAPGPPGLVLGYAAQSPARLRRATELIAAVLR